MKRVLISSYASIGLNYALLILLVLYTFGIQLHSGVFPQVDPQILDKAIDGNLFRVQEFQVLQELGEKYGVRIWLFGGTAAAFAHYAKYDLLRESGDERFLKERFDYRFDNIFRSTQDLDIVVEGSAKVIAEITEELKENFPYFMGSKDQWEVRSLREKIGDKEALLDNKDFRNQHTDSNSVGMIEVTAPRKGEGRVLDLREWDAKVPNFLVDVANGRLRYYFSDRHETTQRFIEGKNPPIISAVRVLTKMFQFQLEMDPADMRKIAEVIREFDPKKIKGTYAEGWLERNGPKLFIHASNVEMAWDTLESLGLRKKLIAVSDPEEEGSLGWWMSKEPLRSGDIGTGRGKTIVQVAKEHGIPWEEFTVAHDTRSYIAYESLMRDTTGSPNVFISREGKPGENAASGDGHYTAVGRVGAVIGGLTVRYQVDPRARDGKDFVVVDNRENGPDYIVWKNKSVLKVIPETLKLDAVEYFRRLKKGELFEDGDRGIQERLRRRIEHEIYQIPESKMNKIVRIVQNSVRNPNSENQHIVGEWLWLKQSVNYPELLPEPSDPKFLEKMDQILKMMESLPHWHASGKGFQAIQALIRKRPAHGVANGRNAFLAMASHEGGLQLLQALKGAGFEQWDIPDLISRPEWLEVPGIFDYVEELIRTPSMEKGPVIRRMLASTLSNLDHWAEHPKGMEFVRLLAEFGDSDQELIETMLSSEMWMKNAQTVKVISQLARKMNNFHYVAENLNLNWDEKVDKAWVLLAEQMLNSRQLDENLLTLFKHSIWIKHPKAGEWILKYAKHSKYGVDVATILGNYHPTYVNRLPHRFKILTEMLKQDPPAARFISRVESPQDIVSFYKNMQHDPRESEDEMLFVRTLIQGGWERYAARVLASDFWVKHPKTMELISRLVRTREGKDALLSELLFSESWVNSRRLLDVVNTIFKEGRATEIENIFFSLLDNHSSELSTDMLMDLLLLTEEKARYREQLFYWVPRIAHNRDMARSPKAGTLIQKLLHKGMDPEGLRLLMKVPVWAEVIQRVLQRNDVKKMPLVTTFLEKNDAGNRSSCRKISARL